MPVRAGDARPRPDHSHERRATSVQLPALAVGLFRAGVPRGAVAGLHARGPRGVARRVLCAPTALWRTMSGERSDLSARALVALPAIAFALFIVIEGGLVFTLGVFALGCVCMHELYGMYERAHPVRLAGFLGLAGLLAAALYGNQFQILLAAVAVLPVLFGLTLLQRHPSVGGMALTLLGIYWIGFAL